MVELGQLNKRHDDFARRNVQVVAVSADSEEVSKLTQKDYGNLIVVADPGQSLIDAVGVRHQGANAETGGDAAAPTTILIDRTGTVRWLFGSDNALHRLSPDEVLAAIDRALEGPIAVK